MTCTPHIRPRWHITGTKAKVQDEQSHIDEVSMFTFQIRVSSPISMFQPMEMLFALMMFRPWA